MKRVEPTAAAASRAAVTALYDVVLLAGSPRRVTLRLPLGVEAESTIEVDGEQWTVADVRPNGGAPAQLICIYAE